MSLFYCHLCNEWVSDKNLTKAQRRVGLCEPCLRREDRLRGYRRTEQWCQSRARHGDIYEESERVWIE